MRMVVGYYLHVEAAFLQEMVSWISLAGAIEELDRTRQVIKPVETYVFNSEKIMAVSNPQASLPVAKSQPVLRPGQIKLRRSQP